jgi:glycosyltransferase involved in cell wall biosynthesis
MKVLWFSNTPANADEYYGTQLKSTGGWLKAFDKTMQSKVDLSIAFLGSKEEHFIYKKANYYQIPKERNIFFKVLAKFFGYYRKNHLIEYLNVIDRVKPDVIHIFGTELTYGDIVGETDVPVVVFIQGNFTIYAHKYFCGIEKRYVRRFFSSEVGFWKSFLHFRRHAIKEQKYLLRSRYVMGRTNWDERISRILAPQSQYLFIDDILRDSFYNSKWVPNNNEKKIIHTTTGNNIYKGLETVCYALSLLNNNDINVEWNIAGVNSNDQVVRIVKRKLKKDFPKKGLVFLGSLNEKELVASLLKADMYVMPAHIENSPNSLGEAMLLGLPCITTLAGGSGTIISDRDNGLVIQDGDPWAMAGAVIELFENYEEAINYGVKGRNGAIDKYSKDKISNDLVIAYNNMINSN